MGLIGVNIKKGVMMKNNYEFWNSYLDNLLIRIDKLLCEKSHVYCDFHIHSDYSADSNQSLEQIIDRALKLNFDIISITDHDSVKVYDELYNYLKDNKIDKPIIVPGVEFTIHDKEYGSQFHILQTMINPKDVDLLSDILYQETACKRRAKKQFERLKYNLGIQYFIKKYNMNFSMEGYEKYLNTCPRKIYEYNSIMHYLMIEFKKNNISNWDILEKVKEWNLKDKCIIRRQLKIKAYDKYKEKYHNITDSDNNFRFFHNLLAVRGADDDFYSDFPCMGDLSVNNFGELQLESLNDKSITVFAHPSEDKLYLLKKLKKKNNNVCGMELNKRCLYKDIDSFYKVQKELNMIKLVGSDLHDIDDLSLYSDMSFYKIRGDEIKKIMEKYKKYREERKEQA